MCSKRGCDTREFVSAFAGLRRWPMYDAIESQGKTREQ